MNECTPLPKSGEPRLRLAFYLRDLSMHPAQQVIEPLAKNPTYSILTTPYLQYCEKFKGKILEDADTSTSSGRINPLSLLPHQGEKYTEFMEDRPISACYLDRVLSEIITVDDITLCTVGSILKHARTPLMIDGLPDDIPMDNAYVHSLLTHERIIIPEGSTNCPLPYSIDGFNLNKNFYPHIVKLMENETPQRLIRTFFSTSSPIFGRRKTVASPKTPLLNELVPQIFDYICYNAMLHGFSMREFSHVVQNDMEIMVSQGLERELFMALCILFNDYNASVPLTWQWELSKINLFDSSFYKGH